MTITSQRRRHQNYPRRSLEQKRQPDDPSPRLLRAVRGIVLFGLAIAVLAFLALATVGLAIINQARQDEAAPAQAIIVLGTAQWDGRPSTTFRARLDHAFDLYNQGYSDLIVLTGGVAPGDVYSEADVGADYLRGLGVSSENLLTVPFGLNSKESLEQASEELVNRGRSQVILVSDPFHMFRIKQIAEDYGLDPLGSPTTTSPIRPGSPAEQRYVFREVFAYVNYLFFDS